MLEARGTRRNARCRPARKSILSHLWCRQCAGIGWADETILGEAEACQVARCPACGQPSSARHSRYWRTPKDVPAHGRGVTLRVRVSRCRCRCRTARCQTAIFAERLPGVAAPCVLPTTRFDMLVRATNRSRPCQSATCRRRLRRRCSGSRVRCSALAKPRPPLACTASVPPLSRRPALSERSHRRRSSGRPRPPRIRGQLRHQAEATSLLEAPTPRGARRDTGRSPAERRCTQAAPQKRQNRFKG